MSKRAFKGLAPAVILLAAATATQARAQDSLAFLSGDHETATQISRIIDAARNQGLPAEPIITIAQQSLLFHAPSAKTVAAAKAVARRMAMAREALAPNPTALDIAAGEDALSITGVSIDALRAVRAESPNRPVAVPLGVLAQLVAGGVPSARATSTVIDLMRRGATNAQLVALGGEVNADVAGGARADVALGVRLDGLTPLLPNGTAATAASAQGAQTLSAPGIAGQAPAPPRGVPKKP